MISALWNDDSLSWRLARTALAPAELIYRAGVALRGELFDRGLIVADASPVGVVSVGNVTVGGTGKTPVTAWVARRLVSLGRKPAIVLRGYGADEPLVHARLNPQVPVIVDPQRVRGVTKAADDGADAAVLDDAFQHRRAQRDIDLVLLSADDWNPDARMLPAGPYREPLTSLGRASALIITAKAATDDVIDRVSAWASGNVPHKPVAVMRLVNYDVIRADGSGDSIAVDELSGKRVVAAAAIGNPVAFFRQIEARGASVIPVRFPDHHAFTADDAARIAALARSADYVVCTLKDAVKLAPLWPATAAPLWYVSLSVEVERGEAAIDEMLRRLPGRRG